MARVAEVAFFTSDVPRLTAFYAELLGRTPDSSSDSHASFDLDGTTLFIHSKGNGVEGAPDEDHVAFADVGDVPDAQDFYWGRSAYRRDPDGRAVELQADDS